MRFTVRSALTALTLVAVAGCSSSSATTTAVLETTTTVPPSSTATEPDAAPADPPDPHGAGASGLGDSYFPDLGNGGYDVDHYLIDLTVDPVVNFINGSATIEATALDSLDSFTLDLVRLEVEEVTVDGQSAGFTREGPDLRELRVSHPLVAGEAFAVTVFYSGSPIPRDSGVGFPAGWLQNAEGTYVASQPEGARTWFPANDHPSDKATFTFRIEAPEGFTVAATGVLVEEIHGPRGTTFVWEMDDPMATYLASVVVAPLERVEHPGLAGIVLRDYLPPDLAEEVPDSFRMTAEMIDHLSELFGPYPFEAYGHVVVSELGAALETQTLTVFGRPWLLSPFTEFVVVHELAHQWFGDSVTPARWRDVWLNEGFATYAELLWIEYRFGRKAMLEEAASRHSELAATPHAAPGDPGMEEMFGITVYQRGALTLHALRAEIGDEDFFDVLRTWTARHAYGNASTEDFIAVAEDVAGRDLGDLFSAWLESDILPDLPPQD